jgi:hypothetical protein
MTRSAIGVGLRRMDRTGERVDADAAGSLAELAPIDRIPIAEQMAWCLASRCGLNDLPPHPGGGRVGVTLTCTNSRRPWDDEHQHVLP